MLVTKTVKTVTNISKLSPTHFVSNIRHQHRCSRKVLIIRSLWFYYIMNYMYSNEFFLLTDCTMVFSVIGSLIKIDFKVMIPMRFQWYLNLLSSISFASTFKTGYAIKWWQHGYQLIKKVDKWNGSLHESGISGQIQGKIPINICKTHSRLKSPKKLQLVSKWIYP